MIGRRKKVKSGITRRQFEHELNNNITDVHSHYRINHIIKKYGTWLKINDPRKFNEIYYARINGLGV